MGYCVTLKAVHRARSSFLLGTDCLRGEVLALRWKDIDWNSSSVRIERFLKKTKKEGLRFKPLGSECTRRLTSMSPWLLAELRAHLARQRDRCGCMGLGPEVDERLALAKWDGSTRAPNWLTQKFGLAMAELQFDCTCAISIDREGTRTAPPPDDRSRRRAKI